MTEKDQIHTLLTDLAGEDPPVDIDLDRQIERGQRRVRRRTAAVCVAALAIPAVLVGGIVTLRPDGNRSDAPVASPGTPTTPSTVRPPGKEKVASTEGSRALLAQVRSVIPELADTPGARLYDMEMVLGTEDTLHAGADWIWPKEANQVTVDVEVGRHGTVPPVCDGKTGRNACTEVRQLPGGSTAYLHAYIVPGTQGHGYGVRLDRPDGFSVSINSAAQKSKGAKHDAPLSLERVLEIAQQITVKP
jgi:hypothetical protein